MLARAKQAREQKHAGATAKRRKMAEELERKEKACRAERSQEEQCCNRLKVISNTCVLHSTLVLFSDLRRLVSSEPLQILWPACFQYAAHSYIVSARAFMESRH